MIPDQLPVLPLRELVVFPHMALPLVVAREASKAAVEDALAADRLLLLVAQRDPEETRPEPEDLYAIGTVVTVTGSSRLPDGRLKILVQGVAKARIESVIDQDGTLWVRSVALVDQENDQDWSVEAEALMRCVRSHVEQLLPLKNLPPEVLSVTAHIDQAGRLADTIASSLSLKNSEAQEVLEISDSLVRLRRVDALIRRELEVSSVQAEIQTQARDEISRSQRENFLREQLRAIQNELGETDVRGDEFEELRVKIEAAGMPPETHEESVRQLQRLERMHPDGPEAQVVRNYLDWMVSLPWSHTSSDRLDIMEARNVLDTDHAHLDRCKDRILEFLSVRKLRADTRGPILCFSGPPGVGKTSLGRSIAKAMGREFVRISLGGVRDEAELRGHRRTYVGAMPGRVIQAMKQAGTRNPVILLDEIDKAHRDVLLILLQLLDEGHLTDGKGRKVSFSNCVIVMTSNLGSDCFSLSGRSSIGFNKSEPSEHELNEVVLSVASKQMPIELWNRIDARLVFMPLKREEIRELARLMIKSSAEKICEEKDIAYTASEPVIDWLIEHGGYHPELGARPMRTMIRRYLEAALAEQILMEEVGPGARLHAALDTKNQIVFRPVSAPVAKSPTQTTSHTANVPVEQTSKGRKVLRPLPPQVAPPQQEENVVDEFDILALPLN